MKCIENSLENKCTDARVKRVNMPPPAFLDLKLGWVLNACSSVDYGTETSLLHILIRLLLGLAKKTNKQQLFGISSQGETSPCLSPYSLDTSLGLRCSDYCKLEGLRVTNFFLVRKKKNTWNSTVAGILSSGCPEYFKSGQKEFNKETGWWGLQENIAPSVKLTGTGVDQVFFYHTWGFK